MNCGFRCCRYNRLSPVFRNLFMKKLTRVRVVPIISASVSWQTFAMIGSAWRLLKSLNVGPFNVFVTRIGN
jgi:hypothetical protein